MSTLHEIEAAADALPLEQKQALLQFLVARLEMENAPTIANGAALRQSERGFPISKGRRPFDSAEVARLEAAADLQR